LRAFDAAILTGGASSRMGRDKAFVEFDGLPLVSRVANALAEAATITTIGGDVVALSQLGFEAEPDDYPGDGPLGGIAQALTIGTADAVVVVACDMPFLNGATVRSLVEALDDRDVAVATSDGHRQPTLAAWRRGAPVAAAFAGGERSPRRLLDQLDVVEVPVTDPRIVVDVDTPDDLTNL
jgi:molybdopterin-guanine dinucleotide biosynthesis protein A